MIYKAAPCRSNFCQYHCFHTCTIDAKSLYVLTDFVHGQLNNTGMYDDVIADIQEMDILLVVHADAYSRPCVVDETIILRRILGNVIILQLLLLLILTRNGLIKYVTVHYIMTTYGPISQCAFGYHIYIQSTFHLIIDFPLARNMGDTIIKTQRTSFFQDQLIYNILYDHTLFTFFPLQLTTRMAK